MQKITPNFWYDKEAKEASEFYISLFDNSEITNITTLHDTPSGDTDIVSFRLAGQNFMAISAGPYFKLNPSFSLSVYFNTEEEIKKTWDRLADGGQVLMEYNTYPWATKYGWVQDKFGLSWQLIMGQEHVSLQKITPFLMFTQDKAGKAKEAIDYYTSIFPNSKKELIVEYEEGDDDTHGFIKHSRFTLFSQNFMAMDSSAEHKFKFNEAASLIINCDTQEEIDHYWEKLSAEPESEQCGWVKDKFGVSWQIVPKVMNEMLASGDKKKITKLTQAFLKMKKFDIEKLREAYES